VRRTGKMPVPPSTFISRSQAPAWERIYQPKLCLGTLPHQSLQPVIQALLQLIEFFQLVGLDGGFPLVEGG
jgi:hypothetical protein